MNFRKSITNIFILFAVFGCGPRATFTEPQPVDAARVEEFPRKIRGEYFSLEDSSTLIVDAKVMRRVYEHQQKIHTNELDTASRIDGDTLVNLRTSERVGVKFFGDSMELHVTYVDTLFRIGPDYVIKKYRGDYFLNKRHGEASWEVEKLRFKSGHLLVGSITNEEQIEDLKMSADTFLDTVSPYRFSINKRKFRKFVRRGGFGTGEAFIKK